jgi:hypothetical protein
MVAIPVVSIPLAWCGMWRLANQRRTDPGLRVLQVRSDGVAASLGDLHAIRSKTARVDHAAWWRGDGLAARRARSNRRCRCGFLRRVVQKGDAGRAAIRGGDRQPVPQRLDEDSQPHGVRMIFEDDNVGVLRIPNARCLKKRKTCDIGLLSANKLGG